MKKTGQQIRQQFPVYTHTPYLVYLDSAASALVPQTVIDAMNDYYSKYPVNIHRGLYDLSVQATQAYDAARKTVAQFMGAKTTETIFTSGTTQGLNLIATVLQQHVQKGDHIVLTSMEHHANLIPWQQLAQNVGAIIDYIPLTADYQVDIAQAKEIITEKTKIVAFPLMSNVLGTIAPAKELIALAQSVGAYSVIDAAQAAAHMPIDVTELDCDFLVFSGHKVYGPTGIGVLYGKESLLTTLPPYLVGGDMIQEVTYDNATWAPLPHKYEAGTPPIAEALGLAAAINFIEERGWEHIMNHEDELMKYMQGQLDGIATIIGPKTYDMRGGVYSFTVGDIHPHDMADMLSRNDIAIRAGHHCAMPLMNLLQLPGTSRASFGMYTTKEDIDALVRGIQQARALFGINA